MSNWSGTPEIDTSAHKRSRLPEHDVDVAEVVDADLSRQPTKNRADHNGRLGCIGAQIIAVLGAFLARETEAASRQIPQATRTPAGRDSHRGFREPSPAVGAPECRG